MNPFKLGWMHLRISALNELQYRANFFLAAFNALLALATGLIVIALVYSHTESLNGWSEPELLIVMGIHVFIGGVIRAFVEPNMHQLMQDIEEGTLDYTLTRPADAQLLVSVRATSIWQTVDLVIGLIVVAVGVVQLQAATSFAHVAAFLITVMLGAVIIYCVWLMITTSAFKLINVGNMVQMLQGIYQAGRWPVSIYPLWLRGGLTFIVPLAFAITVPAEALANRLAGSTIAAAIGFAFVVMLVTRLVWRWGLSNYSGASV
ncbi:MAG: ABC transporter permease [Acidimicrobiia bacterium]|nr:ABC transporter permease [Acidimicrobiia bacterium]